MCCLMIQITGSKFLLYAMTEAGLEIYTTRGFASALHQILDFDNVTNVSFKFISMKVLLRDHRTFVSCFKQFTGLKVVRKRM